MEHCELTLVAYFYIFSILQNIVTSSKCLVTRELRDHWIWYVTVLLWHHNILENRKYTEICHQRATHSYLIVDLNVGNFGAQCLHDINSHQIFAKCIYIMRILHQRQSFAYPDLKETLRKHCDLPISISSFFDRLSRVVVGSFTKSSYRNRKYL